MYSEVARQRRRCQATRQDGQPCRGWAMWNDPAGRCGIHAGRGHRGPLMWRWPPRPHTYAAYPPCHCAAYQWPHRPGGGRCRWPEPPQDTCAVPAGTHRSIRLRWR